MAIVSGSGAPAGKVTTGTYSHAVGVAEQEALVFAAGRREIAVRFDVSGFVQNTTIREYEQVNGSDYRIVTSRVWPTDFDPGCVAASVVFNQALARYRITFQSVLAEAAIVTVPYRMKVKVA